MDLKTRFQWIEQRAWWIKDSEKVKKNKLCAKKAFLSKVRGEWSLSKFLLNLDTIWVLVATVFSLQIFRSPIPRGSLTLCIPFCLILTLYLLNIQATTRMLVPLDALPNLLWVVAMKTALFRGLLHINAARGFGEAQ